MMTYDSASAPMEGKPLCRVCRDELEQAGYTVTELSNRHSLAKCSFCGRRSPVYPAVWKKEKPRLG